jgi:cobalt-zinc-cadmium efflux system outer membrane protein
MKWLAPLFLLLTTPALCVGQGANEVPEQLEVKKALEIALANNPSLKAVRSEIEIAKADRLDATKKLNPAFSVNAEDYRLFAGDKGAFFQTQEITARVDQEIEIAGKRRLRTQVADLRMHTQQATYESAALALSLEVRRAYFQGVLAQTNLEVSETILKEIDRIIELNRVRLKEGDISGVELKRVEVERLKFMDDVFAARLALANAKSTLLASLGTPQTSTNFRFSENLLADPTQLTSQGGIPPLLALDELERQAIAKRPDLKAAVLEQRRADTETLRQQAIRSPNITVGGGYKRNLNENSVVYGVTIPIKIFNRNEGGIARALAEQERAGNLATQATNQILLEIRKAYNAVQVHRERVTYIEKESIKKADETQQIVTVSYRLGGVDLINLLDAERAYRETRKLYNQALFDYRMSLYELGTAIGLEAES